MISLRASTLGLRPSDDSFATFKKDEKTIYYSIVNEPCGGESAPPSSLGLVGENLVELNGIEPMTSGLQSQRSPN